MLFSFSTCCFFWEISPQVRHHVHSPKAGKFPQISYPPLKQIYPPKSYHPKRKMDPISTLSTHIFLRVYVTRWCFHLLNFHPYLGEMIQFDLRIFFRWVGEKPPTRYVFLWRGGGKKSSPPQRFLPRCVFSGAQFDVRNCDCSVQADKDGRTPRVVGFWGWSFFQQTIRNGRSSDPFQCSYMSSPLPSMYGIFTYIDLHVPSKSTKWGWFLWYT